MEQITSSLSRQLAVMAAQINNNTKQQCMNNKVWEGNVGTQQEKRWTLQSESIYIHSYLFVSLRGKRKKMREVMSNWKLRKTPGLGHFKYNFTSMVLI